MIKLIIFLITGTWCNHKWKLDKEVSVYEGTGSIGDGRIPVRIDRHCVCSKCGKPKKFKM